MRRNVTKLLKTQRSFKAIRAIMIKILCYHCGGVCVYADAVIMIVSSACCIVRRSKQVCSSPFLLNLMYFGACQVFSFHPENRTKKTYYANGSLTAYFYE
ncbi:hypothetical protein BDB00DRAFT_49907 [Zychaea mexicana]|uniref:uncharacterized protein n=1 Tax=Zychaea mexicana TaxID=64656 RepID=UPI0022FF3BE6|nr:uncharacterized protein BDB00DRAFT_49907 [Zychaea mexicana]KAI9497016.1 hypothetical protein BDB00DRAFT_49907 [Zychaea mexicana]